MHKQEHGLVGLALEVWADVVESEHEAKALWVALMIEALDREGKGDLDAMIEDEMKVSPELYLEWRKLMHRVVKRATLITSLEWNEEFLNHTLELAKMENVPPHVVKKLEKLGTELVKKKGKRGKREWWKRIFMPFG